MSLRRAMFLLIASMLLVNMAIFYVLRRQVRDGYSDFISFYAAGKILRRGQPTRLYDLKFQYEIQREFSANVRARGGPLPFVRPAFDAWLYFPFAYVPFGIALLLWDAVSCVCLLLIAALLRKSVPQLRRFSLPVTFLAFLSFFPVFLTLLQGQDSILLLLIYALSWRALQQEKDFSAGVFLGLGFSKFPLVLPFLIPFVLRKRLRVGMGLLVTAVVLAALSVITVGFNGLRNYPAYLRTVDAISSGINVPTDMPNLRGVLSLLLENHVSGTTLKLLIAVISLSVLAYACHLIRLDRGRRASGIFPLEISLNLVVTLLVCYHSHVFDLTLLLLPVCLIAGVLVSGDRLGRLPRQLLMWSLAWILFSPVYVFFSMGVRYPSILTLLVLWIAVAIAIAIVDTRRSNLRESPARTILA
jgi:hypothetical protein